MNAADIAGDAARRRGALYTRRLPPAVADRRRSEIASDIWEHRRQARIDAVADRRVAMAIAVRVIAGVPSDLSWRMTQLAVADGHRPSHHRQRQEATVKTKQAEQGWVQFRLQTRRCRSCGRRYGRKMPYCPTCKVKPGHDGIKRDFHGGLPMPW